MFSLGNKKAHKKAKYLAIKSFTYYLPSPPTRKNGYQEKEFDQVFAHLLARGYDLIDFKMQSTSGNDQNGVWLCCILGVNKPELVNLNVQIDYSEIANSSPTVNDIEFEIEHEL